MATVRVESVSSSPLSIAGDAPHWDIQTQRLYYVDNYSALVLCYNVAEDKTYVASVGKFSLFIRTENTVKSPLLT